MMRATHIAGLLMGVSLLLAAGHAEAQSDLPPAKILRSLQFVQDSVVMGDHSARDMQKFLTRQANPLERLVKVSRRGLIRLDLLRGDHPCE